MGDAERKIKAADRPLVFVDLETTGLDADVHEIIEVAAVRVTPWGLVQASFVSRAKPERIDCAEAQALEINGYTPEAWADADDIGRALRMLRWICGGSVEPIQVGQNPGFDLRFMLAAYRRAAITPPKLHHHLIDTSTLAWPLCVEGRVDSLSLNPLCAAHGISNEGEHGALRDVERCMQLYSRLVPWRSRALVPEDLQEEYAAFSSDVVRGALEATAP